MREIRFRAWDLDIKKIYTVHTLGLEEHCSTFTHNVPAEESLTGNGCRHLVNFELMQYTGLTDRQGKEIWEGDIVKFSKRGVFVLGYYVYKTPSFYIEQITEAKYESSLISGDYLELTFYDEMGENFCRLDLEVIGNIYENPELLKK